MKHANVAVFVPHVGCPHRCSFCDQWTITGKSCQPTPQDVCAAAETALVSLGKAAARKAEIAFLAAALRQLMQRIGEAFWKQQHHM